ncbi:MAG TPA: ferrous iron transport protein A, partial [Lactobacillus sp.]|nr:ferrous iron transport protein A [Lactobacillus sp.]
MIHFQGQRLALSDSIASCIEVLSVNELAEQELKPLSQLNLKQSCLVAKIGGKKELKRRLMDMGLTQNTLVTLVNTAPLGDPLEILLRGYKLTLRRSEAELIMVREISI